MSKSNKGYRPEEGRPTLLKIVWTVSKGRDTYGYNICTLKVWNENLGTWVKVSATDGGGYDMVGTVFGNWFAAAYAEELKTLAANAHEWAFYDKQFDEYHWNLPLLWTEDNTRILTRAGQPNDLYGLRAVFDMDFNILRMGLDGMTGQSSVEKIMGCLGLKLHDTSPPSKKWRDDRTYELVPVEEDDWQARHMNNVFEGMRSHDPEAESWLIIREYRQGFPTFREIHHSGCFIDLFLGAEKLINAAADAWQIDTENRWPQYKGSFSRQRPVDSWVLNYSHDETPYEIRRMHYGGYIPAIQAILVEKDEKYVTAETTD